MCTHSILARGARCWASWDFILKTQFTSPLFYQRSYPKVGFVYPWHLLWSLCLPKFKMTVLTIIVTVCYLSNIKVSRNLHYALWHSLMYWGKEGGFPFPSNVAYLFIYLRWILVASRVFPLRDNSSGSRWIHLLPWWCAHSFCWCFSTSISPFLLSARWKCLQVLQS